MTVKEIRDKLPTMVIWMAKEAVMEGVKAYHKAQRQYDIENQKKQSGQSYNYILAHAYDEGVDIAAEVCWKLFYSCSADCQAAIEEVAKKRDGFRGNPDIYFDEFVLALEERLHGPVSIRELE